MALRESLLLRAIGQKAEMAYAHQAAGKDVEPEATDERILGGPEFVYRAAR